MFSLVSLHCTRICISSLFIFFVEHNMIIITIIIIIIINKGWPLKRPLTVI